MDMRKVRLVSEDEKSYTMHDGTSEFRVAKNGLSDSMHQRIKGYSDGGGVEDVFPARMDSGPVTYEWDPVTKQPFPVVAGEVAAPVAPESGTATMPFTMATGEPIVVPSPAEATREAPMRLETREAPVKAMQWRDEDIDRERMAFQKTKADLGIVPEGATPTAPAAAPPPAAAPVAPPRPRVPGAPSPGTKDIAAGFERQMAGVDAEAAAKQAQAVATVNALDAAQKQAQANAIDAKKRTDAARQQSQAQMEQLTAAQNEMKNISTTVDPGRFWASRSTAQRILGIAGMVLGAFGAGKDGINRAAQMLQTAIDRDIDAQKAQLTMRLQQGRAGVDAAQSAYSAAHQIFQDEQAATLAAKATAYDLADNELKRLAAQASSPMAKAQAEQASGAMQAKKGELLNQAANIAFDNSTQRMLAERSGAAGGPTAKVRDDATKVVERNTAINRSGQKLLGLIEEYGTGEAVAAGVEDEMNQLVTDMATDAAKLKDPDSAARPGEVENELKNLFKPGFFQRESGAKRKIEAYLKNSQDREDTALRLRGLK